MTVSHRHFLITMIEVPGCTEGDKEESRPLYMIEKIIIYGSEVLKKLLLRRCMNIAVSTIMHISTAPLDKSFGWKSSARDGGLDDSKQWGRVVDRAPWVNHRLYLRFRKFFTYRGRKTRP